MLLTAQTAYAITKSVRITSYVLDKQPTASGMRVQPGVLAVSRDLHKAGWTFGKFVHIEGLGLFVIADLMHDRMKNAIDIWVPDMEKAREIGLIKSHPVKLIQ